MPYFQRFCILSARPSYYACGCFIAIAPSVNGRQARSEQWLKSAWAWRPRQTPCLWPSPRLSCPAAWSSPIPPECPAISRQVPPLPVSANQLLCTPGARTVPVALAPATLDARGHENGGLSRVLVWRGLGKWSKGMWTLHRHLWRIIGQDVVVERCGKAAPAQHRAHIVRLQRFVVLDTDSQYLSATFELSTHYWLGCTGCLDCSFSTLPPQMQNSSSRCTRARSSLLGECTMLLRQVEECASSMCCAWGPLQHTRAGPGLAQGRMIMRTCLRTRGWRRKSVST